MLHQFKVPGRAATSSEELTVRDRKDSKYNALQLPPFPVQFLSLSCWWSPLPNEKYTPCSASADPRIETSHQMVPSQIVSQESELLLQQRLPKDDNKFCCQSSPHSRKYWVVCTTAVRKSMLQKRYLEQSCSFL